MLRRLALRAFLSLSLLVGLAGLAGLVGLASPVSADEVPDPPESGEEEGGGGGCSVVAGARSGEGSPTLLLGIGAAGAVLLGARRRRG